MSHARCIASEEKDAWTIHSRGRCDHHTHTDTFDGGKCIERQDVVVVIGRLADINQATCILRQESDGVAESLGGQRTSPDCQGFLVCQFAIKLVLTLS